MGSSHETATHIVFLPSPGMGHLIPAVEFAKKIHHHHRISTTLILPTTAPLSQSQNSFLSTLPPAAVDCIVLPPVAFHDLSPDAKIETRISLTITRSLPSIRDALKSVQERIARVAAFVVDLFATDAFDVAVEAGIPPYVFFPSNAMLFSLFLYSPELDASVPMPCEFRDLTEKVQIPGCVPVHGRDLLLPLQERKDEAYRWVLHHGRRYPMAEGVIINTFKEMEPTALDTLNKKLKKTIMYPIGPLLREQSLNDDIDSSGSLKWLDEQPTGSVVYVSFGSGGTLSQEQLVELALGLEMSEQRFLWVLRCPNDRTSNASYFTSHHSLEDPLTYLPEGFLERTKKQGLVVPLWAPQVQILAHVSTGGFLTHCGWNSTLESLVQGVPLIVWPLYAEQRMNAVLLEEQVRVAVRPKGGGRVEVANAVKALMEGEEGKGIRSRMKELKEGAAKAIGEGGSSSNSLAEVAARWKLGQPNNNNVVV